MSQREKAEGVVHPPETPLSGDHDRQTGAQSSELQQRPDWPVITVEDDSEWRTEIGPWRSRIRSKSPIVNFNEKSSRILLKETEEERRLSPKRKPKILLRPNMDRKGDDGGLVQSSGEMRRDEVNQEPHVGSRMETLLKLLPSASSVGLFTASCLLLIPLVIIMRRLS